MNQLCPVCDQGFEVFSDHARCDGCEEAVHFRGCSNYSTVTRGGSGYLYIFCLGCEDPNEVDEYYDGDYDYGSGLNGIWDD